ncbi:hypothetical protein PTNB85_08440 [Pyrenophora teres f. teres]|uniref:Uncharacterized protein n=1 Tax=Pyrenophora teres f. teres TaxID=97479 RepID=A0A6S6WBK8_9PLEO|nr:hypothetical protein PTNB85_08440 [Pyrenophora teres f. teres]CAE7202967.1 hypothetical protein PTTW11_09140 [Pyrenophora teres f. teres]
MPPKATADAGQKMYSADVVAAVLCSTGTTSLSKQNYEMMSALDGKKTATAFQHDFRAVIAKAKELKARLNEGEAFEPVAPSSQRKTKKQVDTPVTPKKRKPTSSDTDSTPSKKKKTVTPKNNSTPKTSIDNDDDDDDDDNIDKKLPLTAVAAAADDEKLPFDAATFIKSEMEWEDNFNFA